MILLLIYTYQMESNLFHKDNYIEAYSKAIEGNVGEKTEIMEYINQDQGIYLDIGPWTIAIESLMNNLEKSNSILYLWDISLEILKHFCEKNNISEQDHRVKPILINTNNLPFIDNSITWISSSSVFHEIYTYGWQNSLEETLSEIHRCLKPWGVFVYRDPWICNDHHIHCMTDCWESFRTFLQLYCNFIDDYVLHNTLSKKQNEYFHSIKSLYLYWSEYYIKLINLYNIKRHFVLHTVNVFWKDCLTDESLHNRNMKAIVNNESPFQKLSHEWFLREWQELYFYLSPEELIHYFIEVSLHSNDNYITIPIDSKKIKTMERSDYNIFIQKNIRCYDSKSNNTVDLSEKKSVIHFFKVEKKIAIWYIFKICKEQWYNKLKHYIETNIDPFLQEEYADSILDF